MRVQSRRLLKNGAAVALLLFVVVILLWSGRPASADPVDVLRLNVGGAEYADVPGYIWLIDDGSVCSSDFKKTTAAAIGGTDEDVLYQDARYGAAIHCSYPVANGLYQVDLKFAEIYHTQVNKRLMDISIEGMVAAYRLDVLLAAGGPNIAYDLVSYTTVNDGVLTIDFSAFKDTALLNALKITRVDAIPTSTATRTSTATVTPTATETGTPTRTATITKTPTATATPTFTSPQSVVLQRGSLPEAGYLGADDVTIVQYEPNQAHYPTMGLYLRPGDNERIEKEGLLRFELQPYVPANAVVGQAILSLYVMSSTNINTAQLQVFPLNRAWSPQSATWNQASFGSFWDTPGAAGAVDRSQTPALVRNMPSCPAPYPCNEWINLDMTSVVQQWAANPGSNNGVLLRLTNQTGSVEYTLLSSNYWLTTTVRPKLSVMWAEATPTVTPTFTNSPTRTNTPTDTVTPTPSQTGTPTETATPSATPTETPTHMPTKSPTLTGTATPTETAQPEPTATETSTPTPSQTASSTATATASATRTATRTPTVTSTVPTATVTRTGTPTATPTTCFDIYEPDGSAALARAIGFNSDIQQHSNALAGDEDWVKFPALPGNTYIIRTAGLLGQHNDTVLELFAADGVTLLASNDDDPIDGGPGSRIDWQFAESGTYYVRARQLRSSEIWGCDIVYNMQVARVTTPPTATPTATPTTPAYYPVYLPLIVVNQ